MKTKLKIMFAFLVACCIKAVPELPAELGLASRVQTGLGIDLAYNHFRQSAFNSESVELYNNMLDLLQGQVRQDHDLCLCYRPLKLAISRARFLSTLEVHV